MANAIDNLGPRIREECAVLDRLTDLLRDEQRTLVRGEIEMLASYAGPKTQLVFELSRRAEERKRLLHEHGLSADAAGMNQLLKLSARDAAAEWQRLLDRTRETQRINAINGTLIDSRMRGTQKALGALLAAARIPGTYAADGTTVAPPSTNRLAVA